MGFWNNVEVEEAVAAGKKAVEAKDEIIRDLKQKAKDDAHQVELDRKTAKQEADMKLKEKEFEIRHLADERVKQAEDKAIGLEQQLAVAEKEIEMLVKITDLNADVIDVKGLVKDLINKLPEIRLTALPGGAAAKPEKGGGEKQG